MKAFFSPKTKRRSSKASSGSAGAPHGKAKLATALSDAVFEGNKFIGGSFQRCVEYALVVKHVRPVLYGFRHLSDVESLLDLVQTMLADSSSVRSWVLDDKLTPEHVKERVTAMLLEWVTISFFVDFQPDPKLVKRLHSLLETLLPPMEHNRIKLLLLKGKLDPHGLVFPDDEGALKADDLLDDLVSGARFFMQQDPAALAQELSHLDFELYHAIEASELMDKNWQRKDAATLSPNLVELRKRFNQLSFWVITVVLRAADTKSQQIKLLRHLLDVAWQLYQTRSYNSMGAVLAGLSSISLTRLHYLWEGLSKQEQKRREELEAVFEVTSNFRVYRALLEEGAMQDLPCIPYIPLHLRDMLAIYEREENYLETLDSKGNPMVNYDKMRALGTAMHTILQFRGAQQWKATQNAAMRDFVLNLPFSCEDDLLESSDRWKGSEGDRQPALAVGHMRCQVFNGVTPVEVSFDSWRVMVPFPVVSGFKDLLKRVRSVTGRDSDVFYPSSNGLTIQLASQNDMAAFLSSADHLRLEAVYTRGTIRARKARPGSTSIASRTRSGSVSIFAQPPSVISQEGPLSPKAPATDAQMRRARSRSIDHSSDDNNILGHLSPAFESSMSPLMSPRKEERRRILMVEIWRVDMETAKTQEYVFPTHCVWSEIESMLFVLLEMGPVNVYNVEVLDDLGVKDAGVLVDDDAKWKTVVRVAREQKKVYLNASKRE